MQNPPTLQGLESIFENVVKSLLSLGGIVLFVMLLVGGFKYLTAGADPKATQAAQNTLTYAIGGLVLLAGSYIILLLIGTITGTTDTITNFLIVKP